MLGVFVKECGGGKLAFKKGCCDAEALAVKFRSSHGAEISDVT